jgi:penicillin-binding protein 1A
MTALPIWINFMKAAIAGKDDEQFPGDEEGPAMDRAGLQPPVKPGTTPGPRLNPVGTNSAVRPVAPVPRAIPANQAGGRLIAKPAAVPRTTGALVRPALPQASAPVRPAATVRRALDTSRRTPQTQ